MYYHNERQPGAATGDDERGWPGDLRAGRGNGQGGRPVDAARGGRPPRRTAAVLGAPERHSPAGPERPHGPAAAPRTRGPGVGGALFRPPPAPRVPDHRRRPRAGRRPAAVGPVGIPGVGRGGRGSAPPFVRHRPRNPVVLSHLCPGHRQRRRRPALDLRPDGSQPEPGIITGGRASRPWRAARPGSPGGRCRPGPGPVRAR
jgi:hypothetical protein